MINRGKNRFALANLQRRAPVGRPEGGNGLRNIDLTLGEELDRTVMPRSRGVVVKEYMQRRGGSQGLDEHQQRKQRTYHRPFAERVAGQIVPLQSHVSLI